MVRQASNDCAANKFGRWCLIATILLMILSENNVRTLMLCVDKGVENIATIEIHPAKNVMIELYCGAIRLVFGKQRQHLYRRIGVPIAKMNVQVGSRHV